MTNELTYREAAIFTGVGAVLAAAIIAFFAFVVPALAVQEVCFCHNVNNNPHTICTSEQGKINGHTNHVNNGSDTAGACVAPTVTPTPTVEQEVTPTVTPTEEVTPTPTEEVTPTPEEPRVTPTPEAKHESRTDSVLENNTTNTPFCSDMTPIRVTDIWVETGVPNDGKLNVYWGTNPNYGHAHIRYSEVDGEWRYAKLNVENDGADELEHLKNGVHYHVQVAYVNGCAVGEYSHSFDPLP